MNPRRSSQLGLGLRRGETTVGQVLERIRTQSRDESEKGRWFENLVARVLTENPEYEIEAVHRWADWPERPAITGLDARDIGIDLVARHAEGDWVAIQCKCYAADARVGKAQIDSFLAATQLSGSGARPAFAMRWIVATCGWTRTAERQIQLLSPAVRRLDFLRHADDPISEKVAERPVRQPWPLQAEAIDNVVGGLRNHDRGRLVMACGTGKTFTSLRIAERLVANGGRILFLAPSIALVSQARREWLRHTTRGLRCRVVCSDATAGGRGETRNDIGPSELECAVTSDPEDIASVLSANVGGERTRVIFCTYQSLRQVTAAQVEHEAPPFDLALMDEAHRTTGVTAAPGVKLDSGFRAVHDDARLKTNKRLYMTATPRIYSASSKGRLAAKGMTTVDMGDPEVYGPELHCLTFARAVNAEMLSDYRVIVLGVHESAAPAGVSGQLIALGESESGTRPLVVTAEDVTRLVGTSLAINGATQGPQADRPARLHRTIAFANSIARSSFYARGMKLPELRKVTTRRLREADSDAAGSLPVDARHLDARDSALERSRALRDLARAGSQKVARVLFNVGLFGEGVDVPALDAIVFMEPRQSQVDIVQAVGRVMRRAPGKRFGYIVVPIAIEPGKDVAAALAAGTGGYSALGKVLRALQAHDGRLAEDPLRFVHVSTTNEGGGAGGSGGGGATGGDDGQIRIDLDGAMEGLYAHVVAASGLGKPGLQVSRDIEYAVRSAAGILVEGGLAAELARLLGLPREAKERDVCTIASLLLANACLLHRRLAEVPGMESLPRLNAVGGASDPAAVLRGAWEIVLKRDYAPVFEAPLEVLHLLPPRRWAGHALNILAECANRVADSLSALGYDHAGPLYHRILPNAKAYGAFYTNNVSALMLARLAMAPEFCDWSDENQVTSLRIMDPACGTGTLLMAALQTIKRRAEEATSDQDGERLHRTLVENVLCGLDVNRTAIQFAACNLTLGAPTVDYRRMNLLTLKHGPQPDKSVRSGSLEMLRATDRGDDLHALIRPLRSLAGLSAQQVDRTGDAEFPLRDLDAVIMNPPFTTNDKRNQLFGKAVAKRMQAHELTIRNELESIDPGAEGVIDSNSVGTYFTPLADSLLHSERGVLAKVLPVTACTNASGLAERKYLARRFHIERVVTSHDPARISFSESTGIHECLLVARRHAARPRPPTEFVSLRKMPTTPEEAIAAADAIAGGDVGEWGRVARWPSASIEVGDWSAVQWYDAGLVEVVRTIEASSLLETVTTHYDVGPGGRGVRGAFQACDQDVENAVQLFWSIGAELRQTVEGEPEAWRRPKYGKEAIAARYWKQRSSVLVAERYDTVGGRLTALWTSEPSVGSGWIPVSVRNDRRARGLATWWNSTPARLVLLNQRSRKLTYPRWSLNQLRRVPIPKRDNPAWERLAEAYEAVRGVELLPMNRAEECPARRIIDGAAAQALGVSEGLVADWRRRLADEPTVTNRVAPTAADNRGGPARPE